MHLLSNVLVYGGVLGVVFGALLALYVVVNEVDKFRQRRRAGRRFTAVYEARRQYHWFVDMHSRQAVNLRVWERDLRTAQVT